MASNIRIYVAGHQGMVGSAIVRILQQQELTNIIISRSHAELDLTDQSAVRKFFKIEKPEQVYLAAAKVGGIHANNSYPAEFIYQNLMIEANVIDAAFRSGVKKLLFLGSSCIYPRVISQPMREDALLTSTLEPTNKPYAIAKIAGLELCESYNRQYGESHGVDYRSVMPTNLYGPGDNYDLENSHVIPAMIRKFYLGKLAMEKNWCAIKQDETRYGAIPDVLKKELWAICHAQLAPRVSIWGSGTAKREFLFVDDMAAACVHIMNLNKIIYNEHTLPMCHHINVGGGFEITIKELAKMISNIIGFKGKIEFDTSKPDGAPRKLLDSSCINSLGWKAMVGLEVGLKQAYEDFLRSSKNINKIAKIGSLTTKYLNVTSR